MELRSEISKMEKYKFYTIIFPQNIDFDNHPQSRVLLWESGSLVEKFQSTIREKILRLDTLKRLRTFSLYSPPPQGGTAQCPERLPWPPVSPMTESESAVSDYPASPAMWDTAKEAHLFLTPLHSCKVLRLST